MQALKQRHGGAVANGGLDSADGARRHQGAQPPSAPSLSSFLGAVQRLGLSMPGPGSQIVEALGSVAESTDFQNAYKLNQKV